MTAISIDVCNQCKKQIAEDSKTAIHIYNRFFGFLLFIGDREPVQHKELDFCDFNCMTYFLFNKEEEAK